MRTEIFMQDMIDKVDYVSRTLALQIIFDTIKKDKKNP